MLDSLAKLASTVLHFLLWLFFGDTAASGPAGESAAHPLALEASPGITSLLDIALFRTVEAELTGTLSTSHGLLLTWLEIQRQAKRVLQQILYKHAAVPPTAGNAHSHYNHNHQTQQSDWSNRRSHIESFARACLEASCDVIEQMATDRFAQTANLSDPFPFSNNSSNASPETTSSQHQQQQQQQQQAQSTVPIYDESNSALLFNLKASSLDTAPRWIPIPQRPRDCWESARLFCPDYVWGDQMSTLCQKVLRQLVKHPYCAAALNPQSSSSSSSSSFPLDEATVQDIQAHGLSLLSSVLENEEAQVLLRLVLVEAPRRLLSFQAALEAESVVSKRLYLIKSEYRAPLRAFWEAHASVQRAPSLKLIQHTKETMMAANSSKKATRGAAEKERLQKLLETPSLIKLLAYQKKIDELEMGMAEALLPFCELARYLDQKKATPVVNDTAKLTNVLSRLRHLLKNPANNTKGSYGAVSSSGIRPLLLDFQAVPRDEQDDERSPSSFVLFAGGSSRRRRIMDPQGLLFLRDPATLSSFLERVDDFVEILRVLAKLVSSKNISKSFHVEKKAELNPPTAKACRAFDAELFKAHFQDWWTLCVKQYEITVDEEIDAETGVSYNKMDLLAEAIRRAEMAVSLAMVSTPQALQKVQERVEVISRDRTKRFDILKESVEDLCLREMDLYVRLEAPDVGQVLELRSTDTANIPAMAGVFGLPLLHAKQSLPLG